MAALVNNEDSFAVMGRFVHGVSAVAGKLEFVDFGLVLVEGGEIRRVERGEEAVEAALKDLAADTKVLRLGADEFLIPGMIDCHVHAAQYAFAGTATNKHLLEWLQAYTFPAEAKCADVGYAASVYEALIQRLLRNGTTMAVMYGTIHLEATKKLVDICLDHGFRAIVGKVAMDRHGGENYVETTANSLAATEELLEYVYATQVTPKNLETRLIQPSVIPRFIPTCTPALLAGLGALAAKHADRLCWVQSHIAETPDEMAFVEELHPGKMDSEIFDEAGLLTNRCVMAHGVFLSDGEMAKLAQTGTGIACCPLSNAILSSGNFRLVEAQKAGVRVGLGTDIAGGYASSILSACRHAIVAAKNLEAYVGTQGIEVDYVRAFWTATMGGALACNLDKVLGNFEVGKQFDACVIATGRGVYEPPFFESLEHLTRLETEFELFLNLGDDRNVKTVFVAGKTVLENCAANCACAKKTLNQAFQINAA